MKRKILMAIFIVGMLCVSLLCGCSSATGFGTYDFIDSNYNFSEAIIKMPDGSVVNVEIKCWADSEDGEQITITAKDGTVYLVNSVNCVLVTTGR